MNIEQLLSKLPEFGHNMTQFARRLGLVQAGLTVDHIALRVTEKQDADHLLTQFKKRGKILSDKIINGRPIYLIELDEPLNVADWQVSVVELPFPDGRKRRDGWEHLEFVLPCEAITADQMLKAVRQLPVITAKWPVIQDSTLGIEVKTSDSKADDEPVANPTVSFKQEQLTIKLHPYDIRQVIGAMPV
ncbi:VOC family protein [Ferrimonas aestuarii]|uniref:VOC family protein n=1 Tax=Ferrimonas aestuarii TaxID=2569539 RepID=A0A4U1BLE0_9GAMM|nr:VOC family protein [Ferrimonas aestuarii]TKB52772.1 VOC family protein [Ferrimonas aestuarii]